MPTILTIDGIRVMIYRNDHPPPHVHLIGPGWKARVEIDPPILRGAGPAALRDGRRALQIVREHKELLLSEWRRLHE